MTRILALRLRGFLWISASVGMIGFLVYLLNLALTWICPVISSIVSARYGAKIFLTSRSSREWNVITRILPPIARWSSACLSDVSICSNSSLSAIRSDWNTRVGDLGSKLALSMISRSLNVVSMGSIFRCFSILSCAWKWSSKCDYVLAGVTLWSQTFQGSRG